MKTILYELRLKNLVWFNDDDLYDEDWYVTGLWMLMIYIDEELIYVRI